MSIFNRGRYTIDFSNGDYIRAISKYNQSNFITHINGNPSGGNLELKNIEQLIADTIARDASIKEISIDYITSNSSSLFAVFPEIIASPEYVNYTEQLHIGISKYLYNTVSQREGRVCMLLPQTMQNWPSLN